MDILPKDKNKPIREEKIRDTVENSHIKSCLGKHVYDLSYC